MSRPFLRWVGGKRWFVSKHHKLLPNTFNTYIEPFLGGGAIFFNLCPEKSILGDSNTELIETYQAIKNNYSLVRRYLVKHQKNHNKEYYYKIRLSIPKSPYTRAARFIYLNRTCWNGLYRVNKKGRFNVPIGTKTSVIFEDDDFKKVSKLLANTQLVNTDFESLIDQAEENDLIFADPPYTIQHNYNGFVKYNEKIFSWDDQKRLSEALKRAKNRGAIIISTNASHYSIKELYQDSFNILSTSRVSTISSKASTRKKYEELIIYSG